MKAVNWKLLTLQYIPPRTHSTLLEICWRKMVQYSLTVQCTNCVVRTGLSFGLFIKVFVRHWMVPGSILVDDLKTLCSYRQYEDPSIQYSISKVIKTDYRQLGICICVYIQYIQYTYMCCIRVAEQYGWEGQCHKIGVIYFCVFSKPVPIINRLQQNFQRYFTANLKICFQQLNLDM